MSKTFIENVICSASSITDSRTHCCRIQQEQWFRVETKLYQVQNTSRMHLLGCVLVCTLIKH